MVRNLKDKVFVGLKDENNPYLINLEDGINYDKFEIDFNLIDESEGYPQILTAYKAGAKKLIKYFSAKEGQKILDVGSGTGISTLELFTQYPNVFIAGVEVSEGMITIARYKFHQLDEDKLIKQIEDAKLLSYWQQFRNESKKYKDQVEFIKENIEDVKNISHNSIDGAIANQSLHWTDLHKSFKQLYLLLKDHREVIWSLSSHFYDDEKFPSKKYAFAYNDFLGFVLYEISKKFNLVGNYLDLSVPKHNFDSVRSITLEEGFETKQITTDLVPMDFQIFLKNHVPAITRQLIDPEVNDNEIEDIIQESIAKTINNPNALKDTQNKYAINPIFKSIKK